MSERRCEDCRHYRYSFVSDENTGISTIYPDCAIGGPLQPCSEYEREPGADDDREEGRWRPKQRHG